MCNAVQISDVATWSLILLKIWKVMQFPYINNLIRNMCIAALLPISVKGDVKSLTKSNYHLQWPLRQLKLNFWLNPGSEILAMVTTITQGLHC